MSKPLELIAYTQYGEGASLCYVLSPRLSIGAIGVDRRIVAKRLTDAELAAEYHAQHMESVKAFDRAYPWGESEELDAENARIAVVERFATLPHYDEDQP